MEELSVRALAQSDFEDVVTLDRRITGGTRRPYFEKRLQAAIRRPGRHLQIAVSAGDRLLGFVLARVVGGEFGRPEAAAVLESIGVDPAGQRRGLGRRLLAGLGRAARDKGIGEIVTEVEWRNHAMLRFLDGAGFALAPRQIVERPVDRVPLADTEEDLSRMPIPVRRLCADDLDAIARIDRQTTGQDRGDYLRRKLDEVLNESAMEVSLVAEQDALPVGFVMARVDFGDFGRIEPVAALDTIGVKPDFAGRGFGKALLAQLVNNLAALHVERLGTEVARETFALLGFLYHQGFGPSQRLPFHKSLA